MSAEAPKLSARWPDGSRVRAGLDARAFVEAEAKRIGEDPVELLSLIKRDARAGRVILKILGLTRSAVFPAHRPTDEVRQAVIMAVVDGLIWRGETLSEACAKAPKLLAQPELRRKAKLGGNAEIMILGNGRPRGPMSSKAVRNAYEKARKASIQWFFEPLGEEGAPAP
ncbi:hypothetical protein [Methylobacterium trifolii]|uniref:hypothetical protein n=1 Tax=Methylobacterium trifolii TaxID=1003092 RepID=UPI001EE131B1|nr:hypothetical protein [Methylobacterium trifolii]